MTIEALATGHFQTLPTQLLAAIVRGEANPVAFAARELISRGQDEHGRDTGARGPSATILNAASAAKRAPKFFTAVSEGYDVTVLQTAADVIIFAEQHGVEYSAERFDSWEKALEQWVLHLRAPGRSDWCFRIERH